ncbi:MAG: glycosyltransferase family 2 protein [Leptonema sp. (in: Bacteria)]|nr:glycosyltransferase family 2 protein [Leptonema sp. (in: bacteria)]
MQNQPTVTLIIPVKNRPYLLKEALRSVLYGTILPQEIIIVLDGTQESNNVDQQAAESIWVEMKINSCQLTILQGSNQGPAAARNLGAARSRTEWLTFLDSDDRWQPRKLEQQLQYMKKRPHLKASHCAEVWIKNNSEVKIPNRLRPSTGRLLSESFERCLVSVSSLLIQRSLFFILNGFQTDLRVCEDYDFWIRTFLHHPIGLVPPNKDSIVEKYAGNWNQLSQTQNIDVYRVEVLLRILENHTLNSKDKKTAQNSLLKKWSIVTKQNQRFRFLSEYQLEALKSRITAQTKLPKQ